MDAGSSFERLVRLVQETGERMVVSLDPQKDPVVLLPLSSYEQLVAGVEKKTSVSSAPVLPLSEARTPGASFVDGPLESELPTKTDRVEIPLSVPHPREETSRFSAERAAGSMRTPFVLPDDLTPDPVDTWDGEGGEEYDAERIFASAAAREGFSSEGAPDRLKASVSRASEAYGAMRSPAWRPGSGGQRLPIRENSLGDEERFSLGMG